MNTITHICCAVAVLWLSTYAFQTLSNTYLGFVGMGLFFLVIVMTVKAVQDDWHIIHEGRGGRRGRRRRG